MKVNWIFPLKKDRLYLKHCSYWGRKVRNFPTLTSSSDYCLIIQLWPLCEIISPPREQKLWDDLGEDVMNYSLERSDFLYFRVVVTHVTMVNWRNCLTKKIEQLFNFSVKLYDAKKTLKSNRFVKSAISLQYHNIPWNHFHFSKFKSIWRIFFRLIENITTWRKNS